jgi:hypothetical protein
VKLIEHEDGNMAKDLTLLVLFADIDPATNAIDKLHEMGIPDEKMDILSGVPINEEILGRPKLSTFIPRLAMAGALVGLVAAVFLIFGIPGLFPLRVGGQPVYPIPPFLIVGFEMTMLGLMGTAFVGLLLSSRFPSYEPKFYAPEISEGKIGLVFACPFEKLTEFEHAMKSMGAEETRQVEAEPL